MTTSSSTKTNWNVRVALVTSGVVGVADSVWNGTVLASYCYDLGGKNRYVGLVEAANGLIQLLLAMPIGVYADGRDKKGVTRKVKVTKLACPATVWSAACTAAIVWGVTFYDAGDAEKLLKWALVVVMMLWGLTEAVVMGPFQAMFADSVPTGDRSGYYSLLYAAYIGASAAGPVVSIALFAAWGNTWSPRQLAKVLLSGMALEVLAAPLFLLFDESSLLGGEAESHAEDSSGVPGGGSNFVPVTLFVASLLSALGSGMTVKFFPLFFRETVGLNPISVQIVYAAVPIAMVLAMSAAQKTHKTIGRVQTLVAFRLAAVGLLVAMIALVRASPSLLVGVYVLRTALANCTYPIEESILMDFVPRDKRARWKSLESIASFGWCGSALVGGIVADAYSYSTTFGITAALQFLSCMLVATLMFVVPRHETDLRRRDSADDDDDYNASSGLRDPLLGIEEEQVRPPDDDRTMDFTQDDLQPHDDTRNSAFSDFSTASARDNPRFALHALATTTNGPPRRDETTTFVSSSSS
ncbi:hypothetical protein CTAYLR_004703 [Chrysophaeum taylorii]|uniref:Major facilitator superfamily (MFS) profile domain-containing protein n=1 Tax=Chrysophaeum taylorii TaxID=2483200 RepID=A0AAD7U844_9STRA|nr:hypothetical protein CTAYLR_004703 [Chrysophaeum taylorii]